MRRVTNGFPELSIAEFSLRLEVIVTSMTGNTYYPTLQPKVQEISNDADLYYPMVTRAEQQGATARAERDAARKKLTVALRSLGAQVTGIAEEDEVMLSSSGFNFTQPQKATPDIERPDAPNVSAGTNGGELTCKTYTQKGVKSVNYYITSDTTALSTMDGSGWDIVSYNKTKYTFSGLTSGQRYYIKVGLVGVRGQEVISDYISYIPQ